MVAIPFVLTISPPSAKSSSKRGPQSCAPTANGAIPSTQSGRAALNDFESEIDPPRRFVRTERYEGWDAYEALLTVELVERNGKTTMTQSFLFPSQELRDQVMKMGLTPQGMSAFYERLDSLLASL